MAGEELLAQAATQGGVGILNSAVDLFTWYMNREDQKNASAEAKNIDARNFTYGKERDAFSENMQNKVYGLNREGQAFSHKQTIAGNVTGITKEAIQQMTNMINGNEALKNMVIGRWAA